MSHIMYKKGYEMKKIIAPLLVVIAIIIFIVYLIIVIFFRHIIIPVWLIKLGVGIILLSLIGVLITVFVKRVKEVKEEKKDDLSKY